MKIVVDAVAYDINEALGGAALGHLMELKLKTKRPDFKGVTIGFIQDAFKDAGNRISEPGFDQRDLFGDEDFLGALIGLVFLARRKAGDPVAYTDIYNSLNFESLDFEIDDDDDEVELPKDDPALGGEPLE